MSFRDYLHEKAEESRHNETTAYLMFLAGTVFHWRHAGNVIHVPVHQQKPEWFIFIPYYTEPHVGAVMGLSLIIGGLVLIVYGIVAGISYSRDRSWYMNELRKANSIEEALMSKKQISIEVKPQKPRKKAPKQAK